MAWARMSDDMHEHPKVVELTADALEGLGLEGLAAFGLWSKCLTWVRQDFSRAGTIPTSQAISFGGPFAKQLASLLVRVGLWDVVPGGWRFHDYDQVYPSQDLSQKRAEAGRKGGQASGRSRQKAAAEAKSKQSASSNEASGEQDASISRARVRAATEPLDSSYCSSSGNGRNVREPEPPEGGTPGPAERIVKGWLAGLKNPPPRRTVARVGDEIADALQSGSRPEHVAEGVAEWQRHGRLGPGAIPGFIHQVANATPATPTGTNVVPFTGRASPDRPSTTDARVAAGIDMINKYRALDAQEGNR